MLPVALDQVDIALLNSLMQDGRKSFRAISRELAVSTPTVKARYDRLVNYGLIKAVRPEIDLSKIDESSSAGIDNVLASLVGQKKHFHVRKEGLKVKLQCDFCGGPVHVRPKVLKFAKLERFFCCTECRESYKKKHGARIQMLKEQHKRG